MHGDLRDLVEMIVERSGLVAAFEAERTEEAQGRADNIREFFGVVSEFADAHEGTADLPAFMEWLALRTDLDTLVEGESSVTLMTVHTAKGLEFPVVFIVGLEEMIFPHANSAFEPSGLEEERRLMYVAITRARERLYLLHAHSRSIYGSTSHNPPSRFIGDIPLETLTAVGTGSQGISGTGYAKRGDRGGSFGTGPRSTGDGGRVFGGGGQPRQSLRKEREEVTETFSAGDIVDHKVFGRGTVMGVNGDKLSVKFERLNQPKDLLLGYAPIVKIKQ
jgi:DNA helicase-2/ATP-dependent DNA helicase PcrA